MSSREALLHDLAELPPRDAGLAGCLELRPAVGAVLGGGGAGQLRRALGGGGGQAGAGVAHPACSALLSPAGLPQLSTLL